MAIPGIGIVSAAATDRSRVGPSGRAAERGPIDHYANPNAITGRAGLFPSRHQSNQVDRQAGPMVRCANRKLRAALMRVASKLILCNNHFRLRIEEWALAGRDPRYLRGRIVKSFTRIAFALVAGRRLFRHPCMQPRGYLIEKPMRFQHEHDTGMTQRLRDIEAALEQIPKSQRIDEAPPLAEPLKEIRAAKRKQPTPIGELSPIVLAKLGDPSVESISSGDRIPS